MLNSNQSVALVRIAIFLLLVAGLQESDLFAAGIQPSKPNVILFLVDDMGWTDCGVYGSQYYKTPNIDRFATRAAHVG